MLNWVKRFNIFCFLDNCGYSIAPHRFELLLAAGARAEVTTSDVKELDQFIDANDGWIFGHLSYELKNTIHNFHSSKSDRIGFPATYFFAPSVLFVVTGDELTIHAENPKQVFSEVQQTPVGSEENVDVEICPVFSREEYLDVISALQKHISRGDCYEINFCMEFFAENAVIDPIQVFLGLVQESPNPFSACYRFDGRYLICASPERFLFRDGSTILSQPMKGTIKRDRTSKDLDHQLAEQLRNSAKDQSENVMVVDLVRNDLSRICREGTVRPDELFGVYHYPQVHQMISTISGELVEGIAFSDIIKATFPMGSMTGAPKHRVMQLIDEYEPAGRGIFSGAVGYLDPDRNFDFNVVIRSIMYNETSKVLSYQVGSGITIYSEPEKEWEECLLKAEAIKRVLRNTNSTN